MTSDENGSCRDIVIRNVYGDGICGVYYSTNHIFNTRTNFNLKKGVIIPGELLNWVLGFLFLVSEEDERKYFDLSEFILIGNEMYIRMKNWSGENDNAKI